MRVEVSESVLKYVIFHVLCRYETWSFAVREGYRLKVFENTADE
jgi:hypothetical protein